MENSNDIIFLSRSFRNYRKNNEEDHVKNISSKDDEKHHYSVTGDSAYHSGHSYSSTTSHSCTLGSSQFSSYSSSVTPSSTFTSSSNLEKSTNQEHSNNLDTVYDSSTKEYLTLTPVTQNAQRISAFHISTPKNEQQHTQNCINKRSSNSSLEEFQNTPKKFKHCDYNVYSTPQKYKTKKSTLFQRLHSAPDFENIKQHEIDIWKTPEKFITTNQSTPKRTPLQSVQQTVQNSTPNHLSSNLKLSNISKRTSVTTPLNSIKENSMNELLNCSNDVFESILNSDFLISSRRKRLSNKKLKVNENDENYFQSISCHSEINNGSSSKSFRRFLKFNSQSCSSPIFKDELGKEAIQTLSGPNKIRKNCPAIHSVIQDRLKAKKRVKAERLANLNRQNSLETTQEVATSAKILDYVVSTSEMNDNGVLNSLVNISRCDEELSPVQSIVKESMKTSSSFKSFNMDISPISSSKSFLPTNIQRIDMDISPITIVSKSEKFQKSENIIQPDFDSKNNELEDFIPITLPVLDCDAEQNGEPLDETLSKIKEEKTPLRTRKSSASSSSSSQKSVACHIDKEKFQILYPTIPETPKKHTSPKKFSPKKTKKNIKSQQHIDRTFYNGATYLNMIAKLEPYSIVLEKIFSYLSDKDLLYLSMTTKVYRTIIQDNYKANLRLIKFIRDYKVRKENYCKQSKQCEKEKSDILRKNSRIKAFSLHNEKSSCKKSTNELKREISMEGSPPVSPSKRKFHEYQKIIENLSGEQNMAKCPRCAMASRIIKQPTLDSFPELQSISEYNEEFVNYNNNFKSAYENESCYNYNSNNNNNNNNNIILPQNHWTKLIQSQSDELNSLSEIRRSSLIASRHTENPMGKMKLSKAFSVDSWQGELRKNRLLEEISNFQPYGECTSIKCKFKYCLECLCEYHPKQKCKLTASVSPSKEDVRNGILQIMKSPKSRNGSSRNLNMKRKSLKRLCFN